MGVRCLFAGHCCGRAVNPRTLIFTHLSTAVHNGPCDITCTAHTKSIFFYRQTVEKLGIASKMLAQYFDWTDAPGHSTGWDIMQEWHFQQLFFFVQLQSHYKTAIKRFILGIFHKWFCFSCTPDDVVGYQSLWVLEEQIRNRNNHNRTTALSSVDKEHPNWPSGQSLKNINLMVSR